MPREIGDTGLAAWGGQIQEEFLRELRGQEGYKRYNEMRLNSPVVGAMLLAMELGIRGVEWNFTSEEGENDPRLELLEAARENMSHSWNDHIVEALTMLPFGYSYFEIVYERVGGEVHWRKFAIRGQDSLYRWEFDNKGGLAGMWQQAAPTYRPTLIPIEKSLLYRTRVEKNNPEGRSMLRTAWIPYYYQKHISQIEGIGLERDLAGLPVIHLPPGSNTDDTAANSDASKANKLVRNIRNDEQAGLVLPAEWEFNLVSTGGQRQFDTDKVIARYDSRMLMSMLSQFLILGQDRVGTQALSSDQTDLWTAAVNAVANIIAETFTKFAIPRLMKLNGKDADGLKLEPTLGGDVDLTMISDFLQKAGTFITWTPQDEAWLRDVAQLPQIDPQQLEEEKAKEQERKMQIAQQFKPKPSSSPPSEAGQDGSPPPENTPPPPAQHQAVVTSADVREFTAELRAAREALENG